MIIVIFRFVVIVSLWMILILMISKVRKLIVFDRSVILLGISSVWNVVIVVCFVLLFLIMFFLIVLIICMLWFILIVKIKNGIRIDMGFRLKFSEVNKFIC